MELWFKKRYKWIALIVGIALVAQTFTVVLIDKVAQMEQAGLPEAKGDEAIAADISNMTGVKTEEIFKLKQSGLSWNEVLEKLRTTGKDNRSDREKRSELLAGAGWSGDGRDDFQIAEARIYRGRDHGSQDVSGEIAVPVAGYCGQSRCQPEIPQPAAMTAEEKQERKRESIRKLAGQFDLSTAVYGMVVLREELGSVEAALDEYLLALQIGIRFEQYISDKAAYLKEKEEKSAGLTLDEIITAAVVEMIQLEQVQKDNRLVTEGGIATQPGSRFRIIKGFRKGCRVDAARRSSSEC